MEDVRRKREEVRRKREEGRGKKEEGRWKRAEGRWKKEEISINVGRLVFDYPSLSMRVMNSSNS